MFGLMKAPQTVMAVALLATVSTNVLGADNTHPEATNVMQGFPPDKENRVNVRNSMQLPYLRWTLQHGRERAPTAGIRHSDHPMALPAGKELALDDIKLTLEGQTISATDYLSTSNTDGLLVLHDGKIIYENYFGPMGKHSHHAWASVTKSLTGLLAALMVTDDQLVLNKSLAAYVPELQGTPLGRATVQQNLDMEVALRYPEAFPPDIGLFQAAGLIPGPGDGPKTIYDFLKMPTSVESDQPVWFYQNGSAEAIGWALRTSSGQSWAQLAEEQLWSRFAADDSYVFVDNLTTEMASGGMSSTLRDLARFGEWIRRAWTEDDADSRLSRAVKLALANHDNRDLFAAGNKADKHPGYSYHNFWWHRNNGSGAVSAQGRFGQKLYIDPVHQLVVAKFSSNPDNAKRKSELADASVRDGNVGGTENAFDTFVDGITSHLSITTRQK